MSSPPSPNAAWLGQLVRFGIVGALGFLTDVGGFNLLRYAGGEGPLHAYPLTAKVVSGAAATLVAWLGNRYWTFRHTRRSRAGRELLLFAVVAAVGTLIALLCLWVSHYGLGLRSPLADNVSANVVGFGLATLFRFWAYRNHVFNEESDGSGLSEVVEHSLHHDHPERRGSAPDAPAS